MAPINETTLEFGLRKLKLLCDSFSVPEPTREMLERILEHFLAGSGHAPMSMRPKFLSDITDDHTPFEFSVAFHGSKPEMRILAEAQPADGRVLSRWAAGQGLNRAIERDFGCSLDRLRAIEELFKPTDPWVRFAMWHAVHVKGEKPSFKIYLNPQAHGAHKAAALIATALEKLGASACLPSLPVPDPTVEQLQYFSLDLSDSAEARIKIYFTHRDVRVGRLETLAKAAPGYREGTVAEFCKKLGDGSDHFTEMPLQTCFAFSGSDPTPQAVTLHFPVRAYAKSDEEAARRVASVLGPAHASGYEGMIGAFAEQSLAECVGIQTYASLRCYDGPPHVTVYLSPHAYDGDRQAASMRVAATLPVRRTLHSPTSD